MQIYTSYMCCARMCIWYDGQWVAWCIKIDLGEASQNNEAIVFLVTVILLFPFPLQNGSFEGFSFFCLADTSGYVDRPLGTYLNGQTSSKHFQDSASTVISLVTAANKYTPEWFGRWFSLSMGCILRFHVNLLGCSLKPGIQIAHPNGSEALGIAKVVILREITWKTRRGHGFCLVEYHILKLAAETHLKHRLDTTFFGEQLVQKITPALWFSLIYFQTACFCADWQVVDFVAPTGIIEVFTWNHTQI